MKATSIDPHEHVLIETDGVTVWVHRKGHTIGRFGVRGIDVHTADSTGCLHCTHATTTVDDWAQFVTDMWTHHLIAVDMIRFTPDRFR